MNIEEKIEEDAIEKIYNEISFANGNEVFFFGILDENNLVPEVKVIARGNEYSVPAILNRIKKNGVIIHNHPSGKLVPSDNDIKLSSIYGSYGGGSYIVNNEVNDIYVIVEPSIEKIVSIDVERYFVEDGLLSNRFSNYEHRKEQIEMANTVSKGINENKKVVVEAGTGTGKTLAYLIPSIEWAVKNNKKIIVSTNTINLQEQLLSKDIPLIKKTMGYDFKEVLVKGRRNYICRRKIGNITNEDKEVLDDRNKKDLMEILNWYGLTVTGDKQELVIEPGFLAWEMVSCEADLCLGSKCKYYDRCFFFKARKKIFSADVLVTNHHMYFADLSIRKESYFFNNYSILPSYDLVVFDEAHNIEKVARDYFSIEVSKYMTSKILNAIYSNKKYKNQNGGYLLKLVDFLKKEISKEGFTVIDNIVHNNIILNHKDFSDKFADFFNSITNSFAKLGMKKEIKKRLKKSDLKNIKNWEKEIVKRFAELKKVYINYKKDIIKIQGIIKDEDPEDKNGVILDFNRYIERLHSIMKNLDFIMEIEKNEFVYWIYINAKQTNVKLSATPLDVGKDLEESLYQNLDNIIFTSATLAVNNKFDYFKNSIGLEEDVIEEVIDSPFDYKNQMEIIIPSDLKEPTDKEFLVDSSDFIKKLIEVRKGNTFLLFTSYSALNMLYYAIRDELSQKGFNLLIQGQYPRHSLIEMFKMGNNSVLFGTDSFWEGVDVKGDRLNSVIIIKLPFKVPSEPIVEAIIEKLKSEGKSPFFEYQIPEAVIKLKQGVGRLIRSKTDKGIITLLDNRILTKNYGKQFLKSLPKGRLIIKSREKIIKEEMGYYEDKK
ncbi:helicase C-terminal domain-containing protein [Haliovirga abyssi]|uniref:DNA 5'-3' helicase n=1 Tax=Haliovirga abyssi TaxID=2996794 RepID=A0AAU9DGA1_9FUSO|nr:helicase C-terminal domain-containing protein [Haliovirga abyssi]BDU50467.1 ATP-dependent helicase [Haliovirga abyssi]